MELYNGDCLEVMKGMPDKSVNLLITSPPYAEQRKKQYGGISEKRYPDWTRQWMSEVERILTDDGSVFINIRPHIKNGVISDYVLRTRLTLRDDGWKECEELIWIKPDSPPLGSTKRPRRAWESILWFSKTGKPKCYPKANGTHSNRIGFENNKTSVSDLYNGTKKATAGTARSKDYIEVGTGKVDNGVAHPALFPVQLPEHLIRLCSDKGDVVMDNFMGGGTTGVACKNLKRNFIGIEKDENYFNIAKERIENA